MNNEEEYLESRLTKQNPFRVPDGYFDQFADQLLSQLPERRPASRLVALRPWLYAAACVLAILFLGVTFHFHRQADAPDVVATAIDNNYIEEAADYAMIDNVDIYACLTDN